MTETMSTGAATPARSAAAGQPFGEIVKELRQVFRSGHTRPIEWRKAQLEALLRMLDEHEADFVRALQEDLGRPAIEAFGADIGSTKVEIRHTLKHVAGWARPRRASVPITVLPGKARIVPEPLGVVLVISPWNYPVQLLLLPLAAALAAGNCVVAKPSEMAPACSAVLARLLPKFLDDRAVVVVEGGVSETTAMLEQKFDHIFFTGSTKVGQVVMEAAAKQLTPVTLELGGKSPTIVASDADLTVAARRIMWGKFMNAGQTCIAPDYVLAEASIRDDLVAAFTKVLHAYYGDNPKESDSFGRIINGGHLARLQKHLEGHGGSVVIGGESDAGQRYLAPTIIVDPDPSSSLMQDEIFGPILPVLAVESIDDAIEFVLDRPKPLALYVFSGSASTAERVIEQTSSGGACVNHCVMQILPSDLPFGGVGPSGIGAYHGSAGFETFSHLKSVLTKPQWPDPKILYPPYTSLKENLVHKVF